MRAWMFAGVVLAVVVGTGCSKKEPPPCPACPEPAQTLDAAGAAAADDGYTFKLVEKDGNVGLVATSPNGKVFVIPVDPRTRVFVDGKQDMVGEVLSFSPDTGGCPCIRPACFPYCRVADPTLTLDTVTFFGSRDVPAWKLPAVPPPGGATPGTATPAPAPAE